MTWPAAGLPSFHQPEHSCPSHRGCSYHASVPLPSEARRQQLLLTALRAHARLLPTPRAVSADKSAAAPRRAVSSLPGPALKERNKRLPTSAPLKQPKVPELSSAAASRAALKRPKTALSSPVADEDPLTMQPGHRALPEEDWQQIAHACQLTESQRDKAELLHAVGLQPKDCLKLGAAFTRVMAFSFTNLQAKLRFLREEVGLAREQSKYVLTRHPRILAYSLADTLRPHLAFLYELGIDKANIAKVAVRSPSLLCSLSLTHTLRPRVRCLIEEIAIPSSVITKMITRFPNILTSHEDVMLGNAAFFRSVGFTDDNIARMATAHPQVLVYKQEKLQARLQYLHSIGLSRAQLVAIATCNPQILSLDIADNLAPKVQYMMTQLGSSTEELARSPAFLMKSLHQRIIPRHQFLQCNRRLAPAEPMPLRLMACTDETFVSKAFLSLDAYEAFKSRLQLQQQAGVSMRCGNCGRSHAWQPDPLFRASKPLVKSKL